MINTFDDNNWENIKKEEISVIQFSASWCAPCRSLSPVLEKLSNNHEDKNVKFYYADVEEGGINTGSAMGIRGVPTTIIFKKNIEVDRLVGNPGEGQVRSFIEKNI